MCWQQTEHVALAKKSEMRKVAVHVYVYIQKYFMPQSKTKRWKLTLQSRFLIDRFVFVLTTACLFQLCWHFLMAATLEPSWIETAFALPVTMWQRTTSCTCPAKWVLQTGCLRRWCARWGNDPSSLLPSNGWPQSGRWKTLVDYPAIFRGLKQRMKEATHTCMHICMHAHMHARTHAHTHTHTHKQLTLSAVLASPQVFWSFWLVLPRMQDAFEGWPLSCTAPSHQWLCWLGEGCPLMLHTHIAHKPCLLLAFFQGRVVHSPCIHT